VRSSREAEMGGLYLVAGLITLVLMVYLFVALLYPEKF
jgi:K+-transporting ATPase KdpF subunit